MVDKAQRSRGLYTPELEHDACGIGFVAHLKNRKSHQVVTQALDMLARMEHRGGQGCDPCSGDGAGILLQKPHEFYSKKRLNWGSSCLHSKSTVLVWCCSRKMNINAPNAATF